MGSSLAADDTAPAGRPREFIQSLERGLAILRTFDVSAPDQTVSEIAARTGLTRATARRFLITLVELGYMETDGRSFRLSPRMLELGYSYLSGLGFPDIALPHLERLVTEVDESSEATILDGSDVVYVLRVPSRTLMTIAINVGGRMPAVATSMGRVLLAALSDAELDARLSAAELERYQPRTITDKGQLYEELMRVRRQGYALVDQELEPGLIAVAVPVRDRLGRAAGAINLSTHVGRRDAKSILELVPALNATAAEIERDLAGIQPRR